MEIPTFIVENVSVPDAVAQVIDSRAGMSAAGNLNDYVKFQMAQGMGKAEGGGAAGTGAQLGAGMALGQEMAQTFATNSKSQSMVSSESPIDREVLTPVEAAAILNVTESDVLAALTEGSLKGKKIGTAWRISRAAIDQFLAT